ncbi:MAG: hypothetical protein ACRDJC_02720 [Thermomicrobiales bacterium]
MAYPGALPRLLMTFAIWAFRLPALSAMAQDPALEPNAPSPAARHAQVIAHGMTSMPGEEIGWRITRERALTPNRTAAVERDPGFVLADEGVVAVTDERGTFRARVAPGEAAWIEPDVTHAVISLERRAVAYYAIALVPASELDAENQEPAPGTPFAAPAGALFDIDLIRDVLDRADESVVSTGPSPAMLLVTSGAVFVESAAGDVAQLAAGGTAQIAGEVVITGASRAPAAFTIARIGPSLPDHVALIDSSPKPTPTPGITPAARAAVTVASAICPVEYAGADYAADCLGSAAGIEFIVSADNAVVASAAADQNGAVAFPRLRPGDYLLGAGVPGDFASSRVRCLNAAGEDIAARAAINQAAISLGAGDEIACNWYIVPVDARGEDPPPASVAISSFVCPVAYAGSDYAAACTSPSAGVAFDLTADGATVQSATAGSAGDAAFGEIPPGEYILVAGVPGDFASSRVRCLNPSGDDIAERAATNQIAVALAPGDEIACAWYIVPVDAQGEIPVPLPQPVPDVTLTVAIRACPPGMTNDTLIADACAPAPPGTTLSLYADGVPLGVAAVLADSWVWQALAPRSYDLVANTLPEGFTDLRLDGHRCCNERGAFTVTLSAGNADAESTLYLFQPLPEPAPEEVDSDEDGLTDARETSLGTNPFLPDSDDEGLLDGEEIDFYRTLALDPDTDGDSLDDAEELLTHGTNPFLVDTDGDSAADAEELAAGSNPLDAGSVPATPEPTPEPEPSPVDLPAPEADPTPLPGPRPLPTDDPDGDGLPTDDEIAIHGTDPSSTDTDGDGFSDGGEVAGGTNPLVAD